ncbi:hypothetical protein BSU04_30900 [Caballeronia sordidicola]|uniref:Uncharacterized protein n=1 Tax=Caballeronia sordidicola TaxID=196367 RepID=A0A226WV10_CABSO|nr:hypothetical protein BSU04_30900 [Caballeronia sordidicola]
MDFLSTHGGKPQTKFLPDPIDEKSIRVRKYREKLGTFREHR